MEQRPCELVKDMAEIQTQAVGHWSLFSEQCAVPPPSITKAGEGKVA